MVAKRSDGNSLASECVKSKDGDEEIIKVYLKARANHEEPVTQLKSEVRHIQEAGSVLKKLREDLSTKLQTRTEFLEFREFRELQESSEVVLEKRNQSCSCRENSQDNPEDPEAPRLLWRLQEAEKRHQLERSGLEENPPAKESPGMCPGIPGEPDFPEFPEFLDFPLQRALLRCQEDAERADSARSRAETEVEQLQRLLEGMEKDHQDLLARMESGQAELERLRKVEGERAAQQERWESENGNSGSLGMGIAGRGNPGNEKIPGMPSS
ncbi:hypothetical protein EK904_014937 [Melospiza melodia maxima]|nr:hypothetical protein EK904_014937 [Melospiza melodia maxima]